jgi:hypothetical protein
MKYRNILMVFIAAQLLAYGTVVCATADDESASKTEEAELQVRLETEYEKAMLEADRQRLAAEASVEKAREQLQRLSTQKELAAGQNDEARARYRAEMSKMREELNNTHRQLQETTREIARVNREVARAQADRHSTNWLIRTSGTPVIGVILGNADDRGVEIIGVSPDGPAERAGLKKGDVIVAVGGQVLTSIDEADDASDGLRIAMHDIEADEPLVISVERDQQALDLTVVPEIREPLSWQSVTRFPTAPRAPRAAISEDTSEAPRAPAAPEKVITIERIVVPEIDTVAITAQIEQMRAEIEKRRALGEAARSEAEDGELEIELHELSEMGNFALQDANAWFGLPMAQGLQLAEMNPGLGEYFKTDRGVLVLKARAGNDLQLESGDVILQVGDTAVNSPAEFMRALRGFDSGDDLVMDIKRNRKDRTLKTSMPDNRSGFFVPGDGRIHTFTITSPH